VIAPGWPPPGGTDAATAYLRAVIACDFEGQHVIEQTTDVHDLAAGLAALVLAFGTGLFGSPGAVDAALTARQQVRIGELAAGEP
jgi:hypothetical protein